MRGEILTLCMGSILLLLTLAPTAEGQSGISVIPQVDSIDIAVMSQTAYPGTDSVWLEVWMYNPDYNVAGFRFMFTLGSNLVRFSEDDTGGCVVDTTGGIAGILGPLNCLSGGGGAEIWSNPVSPGGPYIPPYPDGYQLLFKVCMYGCCIPDTATQRSATVYMIPGGDSYIVDQNGELIPFRYQQGEVTLWWGLAGDANGDSLVSMTDIVFLTNYLYRAGPDPCMCESADCNADAIIELGDMVYLLNYLFKGGNPPLPGKVHCPHEGCRPD